MRISIKSLLIIFAISSITAVLILAVLTIFNSNKYTINQTKFIHSHETEMASQRMGQDLTAMLTLQLQIVSARNLSELKNINSIDAVEQAYLKNIDSLIHLTDGYPELKKVASQIKDTVHQAIQIDRSLLEIAQATLWLEKVLSTKEAKLNLVMERMSDTASAISGRLNLDYKRDLRKVRRMMLIKNNNTNKQTYPLIKKLLFSNNASAQRSSRDINLTIQRLRILIEKIGKEKNRDELINLRNNEIVQTILSLKMQLANLDNETRILNRERKNIRELHILFASLASNIIEEDDSIFELRKAYLEKESRLNQIITSSSKIGYKLERQQNELSHVLSKKQVFMIKDTEKVTKMSFAIMIFVCMCMVIFLFFMGTYVLKAITKPLNMLNKYMDEMSQKESDLSIHIKVPKIKELAKLAISFNNMVEHLTIARELVDLQTKQLKHAKDRAEHEKDEAKSALEQSQRLQAAGQLAGGIAHDFNNLLGGILGYADLLKEKTKDEQSIKMLDTIIRSGTRAAELTKQLLGFARKGQYESKPISVNHPIEEACNLLSRTLSKNIDIQLSMDENISLIMGDESQMLQIMMNLGINATDAMPNGGTLLYQTRNVEFDEVTAIQHKTLAAGKYVEVQVKDTGSGVPKDILDKIFDPFFTTKEVGKGTGLGLSMVYGIIQKHDGEIFVETEERIGTTFFIYFPAISYKHMEKDNNKQADILSVNNKRQTTEENKDKHKKNKLEHCTILVVDDEKDVRQLTADILSTHGANVLSAQDGQQAIEICQADTTHRIQLIILDLVMPKKDGIEAYHEIKMFKPDIKVLFSSGYTQNDAIAKLRRHGGVMFIQKPYVPSDLLQAILPLID